MIIKYLPLLDTIIVMYSLVKLEYRPSKKPLGLVVVKPTLIFSDMVDLHIPSKVYLIIELALRFTPISKKTNVFYIKQISKHITDYCSPRH